MNTSHWNPLEHVSASLQQIVKERYADTIAALPEGATFDIQYSQSKARKYAEARFFFPNRPLTASYEYQSGQWRMYQDWKD
jgi:hypothetical protein